MGPEKGRLVCCKALKTDGLQQVVEEHNFQGLVLGIRRDEEVSRSKERVFSERNRDAEWDNVHQAPEMWDQFCRPSGKFRSKWAGECIETAAGNGRKRKGKKERS
ncbi:sulfate adenylyltransferase subunit 2 [Peptococcaceae bacterium CEB3]|nr:sulfate adenylyltransferase subunit 2 [Peptococcaceae bacterium CEB3]